MKLAVFLGPSINIEHARTVLDVDFLPPARMGDIYRAVERGVKIIGLIDGLFEQVPAVWHKEILYAIDQGVIVFGGSSMGALRAAELHSFGMLGVGAIFQDFASGKLEDDDEVAVVHGNLDEAYVNHSEAMVNLRYGLLSAVEAGVLDSAQMAELVAYAKAQFYPNRCWDGIFFHAQQSGMPCSKNLEEFINSNTPNQKRDDAIAVLEAIAACFAENRPAAPPTFHFEQTHYWDNVVSHFAEVQNSTNNSSTHIERVISHVRLAHPDRQKLVENALLLALVESEAKRAGIIDLEINQQQSMAQFRRSRQLNSPEQLFQWMEQNELGKAECLDLARLESLLQLCIKRKTHQIDRYLVPSLKLAGCYPDVVSQTASKWNNPYVKESRALLANDDKTIIDAFTWYQACVGEIADEVADFAETVGLSESVLAEEILVLYLHAKHATPQSLD